MAVDSTHVVDNTTASQLGRQSKLKFWLLVTCVVGAGLVRSAVATSADGLQIDEAWHTVAGVSYARTGDFRLNPEHPPLVKLWVGLHLPPSVFKLPQFRPLHDKADERTFIDDAYYNQNDPDVVQQRARLAMLMFHGLCLCLLAFCMERVFGPRVTLAALLVLLIDPTVAAHLPAVLTDLPLSLLSASAVLSGYVAFRSWRVRDLALAAVTTGLALASKHSGVVVVLGILALALALTLADAIAKRPIRWLRRLTAVSSVLLGACITLWSCYGLRFSEHPSGIAPFGESTPQVTRGEYDAPLLFNRPLEAKITDLTSSQQRTVLTLANRFHMLPRAYLWGLADILRAGFEGRDEVTYVYGKRLVRLTPWYYFPAVLSVKLTLGLWMLIAIGAIRLAQGHLPEAWRAPALCAVGWGGLFMLIMMRGNSGYAGVRHVLPVFPVAALLAAIALTTALHQRDNLLRAVPAVAFVGMLAAALPCMRPWEYYNELAWGPQNAWRRFGDDGLDNGQRTKDLVAYYNAHLRGTGEPVYAFYDLFEDQKKAYRLDIRTIEDGPVEADTITGSVFVTARWLSPRPLYDCDFFRTATPVYRVGNLLVYRGTFHVPWLPALRKRVRAEQALTSEPVDWGTAEKLFQEVIQHYPQDYPSSFELGNLLLQRGEIEAAIRAYALSRDYVPEESGLAALLTTQIEALRTQQALASKGGSSVPPLRSLWIE